MNKGLRDRVVQIRTGARNPQRAIDAQSLDLDVVKAARVQRFFDRKARQEADMLAALKHLHNGIRRADFLGTWPGTGANPAPSTFDSVLPANVIATG